MTDGGNGLWRDSGVMVMMDETIVNMSVELVGGSVNRDATEPVVAMSTEKPFLEVYT